MLEKREMIDEKDLKIINYFLCLTPMLNSEKVSTEILYIE